MCLNPKRNVILWCVTPYISWELNYENPLLNFCVGVWVGCGILFTYIKICARKFHIFWYQYSPGGGGANMVFDEKPAKTLKLRRWKLRGLKQNQVSIPNYIYIKMTSIKRYTPLAFLRGKHSRIRATPTQFQNFGKILKIEFLFIVVFSMLDIKCSKVIYFHRVNWVETVWNEYIR